MTALRELLAKFTVEVDPEGNLPKGNRAVDALRDKLQAVDAVAGSMGGLRDFAASMSDVRGLLGSGSGGGAVPGLVKWSGALAQAQHGLVRVGSSLPDFAAGIGKLSDYFPQAASGGSRFAGLLDRLRPALDSARASLNEPRLGFIPQLFTLENAFKGLFAVEATKRVWGFVDSAIASAAAVDDMAQRLQITTDQFQELQTVAELGGADVGAVSTAFTTLSRSALEFAQTGKGEAAEAFERLGLTVKDSNGQLKPALELFYEAGDALAGLDNATERQALAQQLMGRSARDLLPVFNDLSEMTAAQRAELKALSVVYGEDFIEAATKADDEMLLLGKVTEGLKARFLSALLPPLLAGIEGLQRFGKWLGEVTRGLSLGRIAFVGAALALSPYAAQLGLLVKLGGGWTKVLAGMGRGIVGLTKSVAPLVAAFLLLEDIFTFFSGGDSLVGRGLDALFGKGTATGVQKTVEDLTAAFKDLWNWIMGDGAGEKAKSLYREIVDGIELMVHDLLVNLGIRNGQTGLQGLNDFRARDAQQTANADAFRSQLAFNPATGAFMPVPGAERQGTTVIDNSTKSVQINMSPGSSPGQVADAVSKRLEADRNSVAARVP